MVTPNMYAETTNLCLWIALTLGCLILVIVSTTVRTVLKSAKSAPLRMVGVVTLCLLGALCVTLVYGSYQMIVHDLEHLRAQLDALDRHAQARQIPVLPDRR